MVLIYFTINLILILIEYEAINLFLASLPKSKRHILHRLKPKF